MKRYICLLFAVIFFQQVLSQISIIKNVTLIDVKAGKSIIGQSVVINTETIEMTGRQKK